MSRGYLVQGVEPVQARAQVIANFSTSGCSFNRAGPAQEQFQVVTLWHVLEHLPDIRGTFKRLFALLADRGVLVDQRGVPNSTGWLGIVHTTAPTGQRGTFRATLHTFGRTYVRFCTNTASNWLRPSECGWTHHISLCSVKPI